MSAADTITPADAQAWIRATDVTDDATRAVALYWRGIITQAELFATTGALTNDEIDARIDAVKAGVVEWLES